MIRNELGLPLLVSRKTAQPPFLPRKCSDLRTGRRGAAVGTRGPPLGHSSRDHQALPSKMPFIVEEANMTPTRESASQAGQRVENAETSFLGETLGPERSDLDMKQLARTWEYRNG